ncbi:MAG: hypothetical protein H0U04_20935 [Rubrobacter sp.]|nr:hypothetical protein [Rubrobacter sp.]
MVRALRLGDQIFGGATTRRAVRWGLIGGAVAVYLALVGLIQRFQTRDVISGLIGLGSTLLLIVAVAFGYTAGKPDPGSSTGPEPSRAPQPGGVVSAGAVAGGLTGAVTAIFLLFASVVRLQSVFISVSDELLDTLAFGQPAPLGAVLLVVAGALLGALGACAHLLPPRFRSPLFGGLAAVLIFALFSSLLRQILFSLYIPTALIYSGDALTITGLVIVLVLTAVCIYLWKEKRQVAGRRLEALPDQRRRLVRLVALFFLVALLLYLPQILGIFLSEIVGTIGLFVLMGIGLNIVVGYAGLLDLGYVAFFAIGAYSTAILISPSAPAGSIGMNFWVALPLVVLFAAFCGVLIGAPVLRLRGDYLAIVTLGFGEIIRILVISNALAWLTGGAQGILSIPDPAIGGLVFDDSQTIYYPIVIACLVVAFVSARLENSRVGRAWNAMREDESVAEAMGISIIRYKLLAFAMGAAVGSLGGIFFAVKIGSIFANSFSLLISIQILALVVLGGMGSIRGVIVGAAVLVGLPELLREFAEYRLLFYGATLVAIMLLKPQGLLPSERRRRELATDEDVGDQHEARTGQESGAPVLAGGAKEAG